ncbi:MAG: cupin domain-containing protein [Chloroflexi bacterium]|nr:cupin domain-containing protein [Chloroflexota bacterium]
MVLNQSNLLNSNDQEPAELLVGRNLRDLRTRQGLSLRGLADLSGLNINTLSLVENGKSSPSVSTLQQLAQALNVPISAFFEIPAIEKKIVFTRAAQRPETAFGSTQMQNLGQDFANRAVQPFVVCLQPGMGSGDRMIVHTGAEFIYCLSGRIRYRIDEEDYLMSAGDSLLFESHQPHCWENIGDDAAQILLVLCPSDDREEPGGRHFSIQTLKKEMNMKIAVITDDGKSISQHFGRAQYYLILTIEEGQVVAREMRSKTGHTHYVSNAHSEESQGAGHGMDATSHNKHVSMAETIADCKALLCGGMGMGAYQSMAQLNIQPVVTTHRNIDEAVQAFIDGKLIDHTELLH